MRIYTSIIKKVVLISTIMISKSPSVHLEIIFYQVWPSVEFARSSLERSRSEFFLYELVQCCLITISLTSPSSNLFPSTRCHRSASNYSKLVWFYCSRPSIASVFWCCPQSDHNLLSEVRVIVADFVICDRSCALVSKNLCKLSSVNFIV